MPRTRSSDMSPHEFKFLRDFLGLTQKDVAELTGVSSPRIVAAWDAERNPSATAAQTIRDRYDWFQQRLLDTINSPLPTMTTNDGTSVVELRRYTDDGTLQASVDGFTTVRHYDAFLRALTAALIARGVGVKIR